MESKKSNPVPIIVGVLVLIALVLAGVLFLMPGNTPAEPPPAAMDNTPAATAVPVDTPTPAASTQEAANAGGNNQAEAASPTTAPTEAAAETPAPVTGVTRVTLNTRSGPGTEYPKAGSLAEKTEVEIIGKNDDESWLLINSDAGEVWVNNNPDLIEIDGKLLAGVAIITAPPLPYDASNPMVQQVLDQIPLVVLHEGSQTCASHGGLNHMLPEVANGNVLSPHSGDFVMGTDNVLFKYDNGGFILIRENPIARFEGGKESLSFTEAMNLFAQGDIVWTGSFGDWPARGVTGCDPAAKAQ
jgi:hypothetical protein